MIRRDCTMCGYYHKETERFQIGESDEAHLCSSCVSDLGMASLRAQLAAAKELARACQSFDVGNEPWECVMVVVRDFCRLVPREEG